MQWTGKLIGGALGAFFGPVGIAVGAAIGHGYDSGALGGPARRPAEQFYRSTFRIMGHVAKADGRVTEREIEAARSVMHSLRLGPDQVQAAIALFTAGKQPGFDLESELSELRASCGAHPEILRVFLEIQLRFALAGSDMVGAVRARVTRVAQGVGVEPPLLARMEAALRGGDARASGVAGQAGIDDRIAAAYRTLEVDADITNDELTKAYRRLMSRHHPDKLKANGLPDSMLEHAKQRTQAIREAYDLLRERRGM
ncbi:MAG: co-chaperone DjlA [Proteobacteria bacterium]|jgi:DnaJ like chaperone protein|nr:co-chaperone DjlA [Pseudomonadota bacterium]MBK7115095.1 co-chaperone DjlA [Pseudomonadota bacterium]MBK9252202.1 co-chaperone DjlA [Pseudomonadota bacterium]